VHSDYPTRETLRGRLLRDLRAIHTLLQDPRTGGQVLECYGDGYAWLRPEHHPVRIVQPVTLPHPDDDLRFDLTELGHRAVAEAALFGPWPTFAEASSTDEHWGAA